MQLRGIGVAKPEWGQKHTCKSCGVRFYDMQRTPVVCPKCGAEQPNEEPIKTKRAVVAEEKVKKAKPALMAEEVGFDDDEDEDDDLGIEDVSELGEDEDSLADVVVGDDDDDRDE